MTGRVIDRGHTRERANISEAESPQIRQMNVTALQDVTDRIGSGVAPIGGVGHRTDAGRVEHQ